MNPVSCNELDPFRSIFKVDLVSKSNTRIKVIYYYALRSMLTQVAGCKLLLLKVLMSPLLYPSICIVNKYLGLMELHLKILFRRTILINTLIQCHLTKINLL